MKPTKTLFPHQAHGIALLDRAPRAFLFWSMRSGKTYTVCKHIKDYDYQRVVVVSPIRPKAQWVLEMKELGYTRWDWYSSDSLHKLQKNITQNKIQYDLLVVDEVHQFRSKSNRFNLLRKIANRIKRFVGLTGTPTDQNIHELFYPMQLVDNKFWGKSKKVFHRVYCDDISDTPFPIWVYRKDIYQQTIEMLKKFTSFHVATDIVKPDTEYVNYTLSDKQKDIITALAVGEREKVSYIDEVDNEHVELELSHRRQKAEQVKGGFYIREDKTITILCLSDKWMKLAALVRLLGGKRILLWVRYVHEKEVVKGIFPEAENLTLETLAGFNQNRIPILFGNPKSAGVGIDVSHAMSMIFCTSVPSFIDTEQAKLRMSKMGADTNDKKIYVLQSDDSVSLRTKTAMELKLMEHNRLFRTAHGA